MDRGITQGCKCSIYWIISDKGTVLSWTTVQHLTAKETRNPNFQERIRDYHGSLEDVLVSKDFGNSLNGYYSFINDEKGGISEGDTNEEGYQGPPYSPEIYDIIDNSNE